jgi:hypothetical protein
MSSVWEVERVRLERAICLAHGVPPYLTGSGRVVGRFERLAWKMRRAGFFDNHRGFDPRRWALALNDAIHADRTEATR